MYMRSFKNTMTCALNFVETPLSDGTPSWKAEIQQRRRSKVFIPVQKPEQPLKLTEMPQWKRDLAERTKTKRDSDAPKVNCNCCSLFCCYTY